MLSKKILLIFVCCAFVVFGMTGISGAAAMYVYDGGIGSGTWSDANKTGSDSLMCWAAAGSNVLSWGLWDGGSSLTTEDQIFSYGKSYWPNELGNTFYFHEWYFTGNDDSAYYTKDFPDNGGAFYSTELFEANIGFDWIDPEETFLYNAISGDKGTVLSITGEDSWGNEYSHSITLWGIDTDADQMWITDSDDGLTGLVPYSYSAGVGGVDILDYTNTYTTAFDFHIDQAITLGWNIDDVDPNNGEVPEPATMLLLGSGLIGLAGFRRKFKI